MKGTILGLLGGSKDATMETAAAGSPATVSRKLFGKLRGNTTTKQQSLKRKYALTPPPSPSTWVRAPPQHRSTTEQVACASSPSRREIWDLRLRRVPSCDNAASVHSSVHDIDGGCDVESERSSRDGTCATVLCSEDEGGDERFSTAGTSATMLSSEDGHLDWDPDEFITTEASLAYYPQEEDYEWGWFVDYATGEAIDDRALYPSICESFPCFGSA
jgi:hypothetical protein